jgi:hypothetical protein
MTPLLMNDLEPIDSLPLPDTWNQDRDPNPRNETSEPNSISPLPAM